MVRSMVVMRPVAACVFVCILALSLAERYHFSWKRMKREEIKFDEFL